MVYDFIVGSGNEDLINEEVASCLYAGIIGDTGSFRFPADLRFDVHEMVAALKKKGIASTLLYTNTCTITSSKTGYGLLVMLLLHRMEVFYEYNAALITIPKSDLLKFNVKTGDTEGLVNYPLSIQGIKVAGLVIDRDEERKWSFRSKGNFDVNTFARKYFNGGGHFNASGGRSADSLAVTAQLFKKR